jgi:DNA-directed RNA polymerase specialized sigma24 family protein
MHTDTPVARLSITRFEQIAVLHGQDARRLERRVARHMDAEPQTIEDACSFAWLQLLTHTSVDLGPPSGGVLGWLTQTATREAWRLEARRARDQLLDHVAIERELLREEVRPSVDELAAQHARLDLVAEIPERPRRFLMRLALGYSYCEIAAHENASLTTTNKQIARAKRSLRALDARGATPRSGAAGRPVTRQGRGADQPRAIGLGTRPIPM